MYIFLYIICVLSLYQDPKHTVEDLVRGRGSWLSQVSDKTGRLQADLQLGWATTITYIDIGKVICMSGKNYMVPDYELLCYILLVSILI